MFCSFYTFTFEFEFMFLRYYILDFNLEKLLTRKLITLSGVTICLDKQNSSGRIEMYLVMFINFKTQ